MRKTDEDLTFVVDTGERVLDVACGSGDAQTIAVTDVGSVYSWGDGDYGKLGRGGSDGSKVPRLVDKLQVGYSDKHVLLYTHIHMHTHGQ